MIPYIEIRDFFPENVRAVITTRTGGENLPPYRGFNLALHVGDDAQKVLENRERLRRELGVDEILWIDQTHSNRIFSDLSPEFYGPEGIPSADASLSRIPGHACAVMTADCVPILLSDSKGEYTAAIHAGWRGIINGIIPNTLERFGVKVEDILAYIGPCIGPENYEIGQEVFERYAAASPSLEEAFIRKGDRLFLDLKKAVRITLLDAGLKKINQSPLCTFKEKETFYSYRRDGQKTGRFASLIWKIR